MSVSSPKKSSRSDRELRDVLCDVHDDLERVIRGVADSIRDDARDAMRDDYAEFERQLLKHLDWEEMYLLPRFERLDPDAAQTIRADHRRFRATLGEIGLEIDLHLVRAERFEQFARDLESHSKVEEAMYRALATFENPDHATLLRRYADFADAS